MVTIWRNFYFPAFDIKRRGKRPEKRRAVDTPRFLFISRDFIGVGGPRKRNPVVPAKSGKRTTPFET